MPFGYIGQNQTKQKVKNSGVLSSFEVSHLVKQGHIGDGLEFISEQTASNSAIEFTLSGYDVYMIQVENGVPTTQTEFGIRLKPEGGSYATSSYEFANQRLFANGTFEARKSTGQASIRLGGDVETSDEFFSTIYIFNANNTSHYTTITHTSVFGATSGGGQFGQENGGGIYKQTNNASTVKIGEQTTVGVITSGTARLYGIKQWAL